MGNIEAKLIQLNQLYADYEDQSREFKTTAICQVGCSWCCSDVGNVDIVTLEGLRIHRLIQQMPVPKKKEITKRIARNKRQKEHQRIAPCPFLEPDQTCLIYPDRPFSCRQLYSLAPCQGKGPTVHRQSIALNRQFIRSIRQLDSTGYSGHLSFILHLLDKPQFRKTYVKGGFDPGKISKFATTHHLTMNNLA